MPFIVGQIPTHTSHHRNISFLNLYFACPKFVGVGKMGGAPLLTFMTYCEPSEIDRTQVTQKRQRNDPMTIWIL